MTCLKCKSENVSIQAVNEQQLVTKIIVLFGGYVSAGGAYLSNEFF